jgi:outer membrane protein assembly factor BamB
MFHGIRLFLCCTIVLVSIYPVAAEEWPQYRGPLADGKSSDSIGQIDWSGDGPEVVWKQATALGFSSFSIADGRAFTLIARDNAQGKSAETCVALDAETGQERWSFTLDEISFRGGGDAGARDNRGGDGPRTTPLVDGGRVYIYDSEMNLVCLDAATGKLVWSQDILNDFNGKNITWSNATAPIIDGELVYVAGGGEGQSFLAFNKANGKVVWKSGNETMTHATPVITTLQEKRQLIFFMQAGLVAVDPATGEEFWRTEFPYATSTAASPVVDDDLVYCSAGYGGGAGLFRVDQEDAVSPVWRKPNRLINQWSTPVVYEGHLYGMFGFKQYGKSPLQCVELATGEIKWEKLGFGPGNCIIVGDKVVALSDAGELVVVAAEPSKYNELGRAKVLSGKCWSTPAYSNGRVYIRSTEEGACVLLK